MNTGWYLWSNTSTMWNIYIFHDFNWCIKVTYLFIINSQSSNCKVISTILRVHFPDYLI